MYLEVVKRGLERGPGGGWLRSQHIKGTMPKGGIRKCLSPLREMIKAEQGSIWDTAVGSAKKGGSIRAPGFQCGRMRKDHAKK